MSCFEVQVLEPNINTIEVETCINGQVTSVDIIQYDIASLEVTHCVALLPSDYDTIVSGIVPVKNILGGTGIYVSSESGIFTVNASGLQPSGNYSIVGHSHVSSDISNFNSSVSGLLPVKNILSGSGIEVSSNSGNFTIAVTGNFGLTSEEVDDRVGNLLIAGQNILLDYNDSGNFLTISTVGLQSSGNYSQVGHYHNSSDILDFITAVSGLLPSTYDSAVPWTVNHTLADGTRYLVNDLVYENGRLYKANYDNESLPVSNATYWTDIGPGYRLNIDGRDIPNIPYPVTSVNGQDGDVELSTLDLDDFNTSVSGLLPPIPSVSGVGYIVSDFTNNTYIISATGLQPSGNYSLTGHGHNASDISDFNNAVSGLIPPSNFTSLSGISGVVVTNSGTNYYVGLSDPTIQLADITDLSSNTRTFLLTPSSNNLSTLISDETGSGILVFNTSPAFSGIPTVPTATSGTDTNQIASTAFVRTEISNLVDSAPSTLDTLNELAAALGDDPNFATTITNTLAGKANLSGAIFTGSVTISSGTGNFNSLSVNNVPVSVSGHQHNYTDIINFASGIDQEVSTLLVAGNYINLNYDTLADTLTITATGLQPSGNYSIVGHTHTSSNITDFNSSVSGLLPTVTGTGYVNSSFNNNIYTISVSGLQPSGNYSIDGHTHISANITDFNSSVSGLLPVKNIIGGSGINVSSLSGTYTVAVTGIAGLISEEVDDRVSQLLVEGTGVNLTYNDPSGTLTIDNLHSEINVLSQEPQGFVNRADSIISFNDSTRTFTIQPAVSGGSYNIYAEGIKVVKSGIQSVVIDSGTALNYLHFDTTPPHTLHTKTTGFNFDTDIPIAFIHWNADINQSTFFGEERHGIRMDSVTHKWIHNTFGMQYISGLSIGGYTLLGDGSSNTHAQIDISDGILYQEDIIVNITNGSGTAEFVQPLSPIAYIPTYYHSGSTGQWVRDNATAFPLKYNATRAQYNLYAGGVWTTPNVPDKKYFAMWIVATNDINDPILAILGQREDSSLGAAESNNNWNDINLTNIPTQEIRPLYRLIFITDNTFTNTPKSSLQSILDIRVAIQSTVAGVSQNDHGTLFGLADDDHNQYVHINNARTIDAVHTFSNGLNASGLINATSGNFSSLTVNNTGVVASSGGNSGYLSKFTSSNAIDNSVIYQSGSNIGIGTTTPSGHLDVAGNVYVRGTGNNLGTIYIKSSASPDTSLKLRSDSNGNLFLDAGAYIKVGNQDGTAMVQGNTGAVTIGHASNSNNNQNIIFNPRATERARLTHDGNFGIGTATPSGRLDVRGNIYASGSLGINNPAPSSVLDVIGESRIQGLLYFNQNSTDAGDSSRNRCSIQRVGAQNLTLTGGGNTIQLAGDGGKLILLCSSVGVEIGSAFANSYVMFNPGGGSEKARITPSGWLGIGTSTPGGQLHVAGTGIFDNSIRLGSSSTSGTIVGLSTTGAVPAIVFDTVGNNHGNNQTIYDFRENGTSLISIDGIGNLQANAGNIVSTATNPSVDNGSFIGQGMRRRTTVAGMEFAWGESITSVSEPGIDLFPIGGTHISSGILFRLSKNSTRSDVAMLVNGSGNIGIGTTTPSGQLHVVGTGIVSSRLGVGTLSPNSTLNVIGSGLFASTTGVVANALLDVYSTTSGEMVFNVEGTNGSLFSVVDNLSDSLISVNNNAGLPVLEVFSDDRLVAGRFNQNDFVISSSGNVGVGTSNPQYKLHVIGSGNFSQNLLVNGTGVSLIGHTHSSSDITDFNSSVSGLLPTISNSGDNRLLTSTGSSVGIDAESNLTFDGSTLNIDGNLVFDSFTESVVAIGNSSTSQTLSLASGTVQTCTLTGNCTFTMPTATAGKSFTMFLNSGSGNYTASFSGVLWSDSAPPTITTAASKVDILSFISDGTYWYGSYSQNYG